MLLWCYYILLLLIDTFIRSVNSCSHNKSVAHCFVSAVWSSRWKSWRTSQYGGRLSGRRWFMRRFHSPQTVRGLWRERRLYGQFPRRRKLCLQARLAWPIMWHRYVSCNVINVILNFVLLFSYFVRIEYRLCFGFLPMKDPDYCNLQ